MSDGYVFIERDGGECEKTLISELTYVAVDRGKGQGGRAFSGNRFIGKISSYDSEKVKACRSEIVHKTDYRLCDWLSRRTESHS